mmetsp:Transcript_41008/g.112816  ORF Transcript_41008/g.112816 Transcript_41008/m.112816 type:complete len:236 (-) Transcript_41008:907-1614(-)
MALFRPTPQLSASGVWSLPCTSGCAATLCQFRFRVESSRSMPKRRRTPTSAPACKSRSSVLGPRDWPTPSRMAASCSWACGRLAGTAASPKLAVQAISRRRRDVQRVAALLQIHASCYHGGRARALCLGISRLQCAECASLKAPPSRCLWRMPERRLQGRRSRAKPRLGECQCLNFGRWWMSCCSETRSVKTTFAQGELLGHRWQRVRRTGPPEARRNRLQCNFLTAALPTPGQI